MTYILFTKLQEIYINVKWKEYCNIGIKNCGQTRSSIAVILLRNTKLIPVQDTMLDYKYLVKETNAFHIHKSFFMISFLNTSFKKYTLKLIDTPIILHISKIIMQWTYFVSFALYMVVVLKKPLKLGTTLTKRLFIVGLSD